jgi:potassium large conductance calcium-activated channel subfamily M alpha protein 1
MMMCITDCLHSLLQNSKYGDLFAYSLRTFGILCIGLYRFRDTTPTGNENPSSKRYVITNPPDNFPLLPTDKVSVLL